MNNVVIFTNFDLSKINSPESKFYNVSDENIDTLNSVSDNIVLGIQGNATPEKLSFSTNGIDGIGVVDKTFDIGPIYYANQDIFFTVKYKTEDNYDLKSLPNLSLSGGNTQQYGVSLSCFQVRFLSSGNTETYIDDITFNENGTLSSFNGGGFLRGKFKTDKALSNLKIKGESFTGSKTITGESGLFDINPIDGFYKYRKVNEDNDQKENYKNLIYQDILTDKENFFNNFLGTIVGDVSSNTDTLGIKIYEKISNFVSNNSDVNYSNLNSFLSQLDNLDIDFEKFNVEFPPSLQRIVDNLSLNLSIQKGSKNNYNFNFNDKGYVNSPNTGFGKNLGSEIRVSTGIINPGTTPKIVAYEKFSEKYTLLNTNLISSYGFRYIGDTLTYNLSDYTDSWGWGLILPDDLGKNNFIKLESGIGSIDSFLSLENGTPPQAIGGVKGYYRLVNESVNSEKSDKNNLQFYYNFYNFNKEIEGTYLQKYIDYDNDNTRLGNLDSYSTYSKRGGIVDDLIINNLYNKVGLLETNPYPSRSSFKPHYMYNKEGKAFYAATYEEHLRYFNEGFTHYLPLNNDNNIGVKSSTNNNENQLGSSSSISSDSGSPGGGSGGSGDSGGGYGY